MRSMVGLPASPLVVLVKGVQIPFAFAQDQAPGRKCTSVPFNSHAGILFLQSRDIQLTSK
jgi:hypothetical protein